MILPNSELTGLSLQSKIFNLFIELGESQQQEEKEELQKLLAEQLRRLSQLQPYLRIKKFRIQKQEYQKLLSQTSETIKKKKEKLAQKKKKLNGLNKQSEALTRNVEGLKNVICQTFDLEERLRCEKQSKKLLGAIENFHKEQTRKQSLLQAYQKERKQLVNRFLQQIFKCREGIFLLDKQIEQEKTYIQQLSQVQDRRKKDLAKYEKSKIKYLRFDGGRNNFELVEKEKEVEDEDMDDLQFLDERFEKGQIMRSQRGGWRRIIRYGPWMIAQLVVGLWLWLSQ